MKIITHPQYTIRAFSPEQDLPGLLTLYTATEMEDQEGKEVTEQYLQAQLDLPGHNPQLDRWVAASPDDPLVLLGSALVRVAPGSSTADANITVHPGYRRQGIGSTLLLNMINRAHKLKATSLEIYANRKLAASLAFLQRHNFLAQGAYTELRLAGDTRLPPVVWPYGYTMRPYSQVQDLPTLTEAMNLSYIPLWGHREVSQEEMASWLPDFNQDGLFLVFSEKGRVIGISRTEPSLERTKKNGIPTGYIDAPGIVPQHRRLDLYRALVLTGIGWLREQRQTLVEMESWGDKLEVLKMYRELGFKDIRQLVCYHLDLIKE